MMAEDIVKIMKYEHHGKDVYVREDLKGTHWDSCLCAICEDLNLGSDNKCPIADAIYKNCVEFGVVTPISECPAFKLMKGLEDKFEVADSE